jgi:hypothetical protein
MFTLKYKPFQWKNFENFWKPLVTINRTSLTSLYIEIVTFMLSCGDVFLAVVTQVTITMSRCGVLIYPVAPCLTMEQLTLIGKSTIVGLQSS